MNLGFHKLENTQRWKYLIFPALLVVGLILRLILSSYWTYEGDFGTWKAWAYGIYNTGFSKFYDQVWCDYIPGYLYVLWLLEYIHSAFPAMSDKILFKLPANLSDLGISILVFLVLRNITSLKNAQLTSLFYFFNPASISNSTFWGQVDSVHTFPLLLSVVFGLRGCLVASGVFASLAFMIKPQSVVIFPILGFFAIIHLFIKKEGGRLGLKDLLPGVTMLAALVVTSFIITLPFISSEIDSISDVFKEPVYFMKERFDRAYSQYNIASLNAFNFWGLVAMWQNDQTKFLDVTYQRWGTMIFGIVYALVLVLLFRFNLIKRVEEAWIRNFDPVQKQNYVEMPDPSMHSCLASSASPSSRANSFADGANSTIRTIHAVTLILFALFLFVTRTHERHFLPTIAFFTLIAFRSSLYWFFYALISFVYVFNMFYAYIELMPRVSESARPYLILPASSLQPFIPGMVFLLLIIFLIVLVDFIRNSVGLYRMTNS